MLISVSAADISDYKVSIFVFSAAKSVLIVAISYRFLSVAAVKVVKLLVWAVCNLEWSSRDVVVKTWFLSKSDFFT